MAPRRFAAVVALATLAAAGAGLGAQQVPPAAPLLAKGTGLVLGQVLDGSTGRPVPHAVVTLTPAAPPPRLPVIAPLPPATECDDDGRFVLFDVPAGSYALSAAAPEYSGPSRPLDLSEGQRVGDAVVRLLRSVTIGGRVLDEFGDPMVGVDVDVRRRAQAQDPGRPSGPGLVPMAVGIITRTDDRGMYRVTRPPGDYVVVVPSTYMTFGNQMPDMLAVLGGAPSIGLGGGVSATGSFYAEGAEVQPWGTLARSTPPPKAGGPLMVYPSTFCPDTASPALATVITLGPGDQRLDADVHLRLVSTRRVTGRLIGPNGPVPHELVHLMPSGGTAITGVSGATDPQGRFTILGVAPGQYTVQAAQHWPPSDTQLTIAMSLTVGLKDIDNLLLRVLPERSK